VQAQGYVTLWLSLVIGGPAASGIYAAALSIVSFANPLLFGFYNILAPRAVRALQCQGATGLRRQAASDSLLLALLMTPFCLLIYVFGADLQRMLYPSVEYGADTHLLAILALGTFAGAVGVPAAVALSSAERARAAARVRIAAAALNIVLVSILMALFGLLGAAYGMLAAELAGSLGCWVVLLLSFSDIERWSVRSSQLASGETAVAAVS
jgi:O-antigen/teichoic acid export membrane protein